MNVYVLMHASRYTHMHIYIYIYMHMFIHTCVLVHMYAWICVEVLKRWWQCKHSYLCGEWHGHAELVAENAWLDIYDYDSRYDYSTILDGKNDCYIYIYISIQTHTLPLCYTPKTIGTHENVCTWCVYTLCPLKNVPKAPFTFTYYMSFYYLVLCVYPVCTHMYVHMYVCMCVHTLCTTPGSTCYCTMYST